MLKTRLSLSTFLFGGMAFALFAILTFTTIRNIARDKALCIKNALSQGYWMARSLEIGHSIMLDNHVQAMREVVREIEKHSAVRALVILDVNRTVLIASDTTLEGSWWPDDPGDPPE
jgi:sensor histidine kinase regulating citrate/malate metabolism